jgi:uncharacterized repeat protein (TIGR01451 family)
VLAIAKSHTGNFSQGQQGATYTIIVSNTGTAPIAGDIEVQEHIPAGLTFVSISGNGWSCGNPVVGLAYCDSDSGAAAGASYAPITVTVNVSATAPASVTNTATVSGNGIPNSPMASDPTTITASGSAQWVIAEFQYDSFTQGETATANISLMNTGTQPSTGLVTVTQIAPTGLTTITMSGTGWTCSCSACSRSDPLALQGTYPAITVTFNIAANAPSLVTASATAQGGGAAQSAMATDQIVIDAGFPPPQGPPRGSFDTPVNNSPASGAVGVTGWAVSYAGIAAVDVWREPNPGEAPAGNGLVYIGTAEMLGGARPDVQLDYPSYPGVYQAGWGFQILTNELPSNSGSGLGNGAYNLHAIAHGKDGTSTDLGTRTIIVDNASAVLPFGTIDTPAQGGTASGTAYVNFGWAVTPLAANVIPKDGSTIQVFVDKVPMGHPVYNNYRVDVATLFPGLQNSEGAVGYLKIDTTKLSNGVHTISWSVKDSAGQSTGIGSRFFTVQNACPAN